MQSDSLPLKASSLVSRAVVPVPSAISPGLSVLDAIAQMSASEDSCVIIVEQQRPVGIFTERDLVRLIASEQRLLGKTISEVMTQPVTTICIADITDAFAIFQKIARASPSPLPGGSSRWNPKWPNYEAQLAESAHPFDTA